MAAMLEDRPKAVLADPQKIVCECLAHILSERFDVVCVVQTATELYSAVHSHAPKVVVLDACMAEHSGLQIVRQLKKEGDLATYVVISEYDSVAAAAAAMKSGASAFVPKQRSGEVLMDAVNESMAGRPYVALSTFKRLGGDDYGRFHRLTHRQRSVMRLLLSGMTTKRIGQKLGISHRTVESHKYTVMRIFNVDTTLKLMQVIKPFAQEL